jgi:hypothetical protein
MAPTAYAGAPAQNPTQSTVTTTNIVANENRAHRRFGLIRATSLAKGLAMPTSIPRRRAAGKGVPSAGPGEAATRPSLTVLPLVSPAPYNMS